jgi:hypothetical protein
LDCFQTNFLNSLPVVEMKLNGHRFGWNFGSYLFFNNI